MIIVDASDNNVPKKLLKTDIGIPAGPGVIGVPLAAYQATMGDVADITGEESTLTLVPTFANITQGLTAGEQINAGGFTVETAASRDKLVSAVAGRFQIAGRVSGTVDSGNGNFRSWVQTRLMRERAGVATSIGMGSVGYSRNVFSSLAIIVESSVQTVADIEVGDKIYLEMHFDTQVIASQLMDVTGAESRLSLFQQGDGVDGGSGLPTGSAARNALRWNTTDSEWEAFSDRDDWFFALTPNTDTAPVAAAIIDALTNGVNRSIVGNSGTHYNSAVAEVVLTRWRSPFYNIFGARNSWAYSSSEGEAAATAALAAFGVSPVYHWIIVPNDVAGPSIENRFWTIEATDGGGGEAPGVISNVPAYTRVNQDLEINGVTYLVARARVEWEAGTVNFNTYDSFTAVQDVVTAVWVTP